MRTCYLRPTSTCGHALQPQAGGCIRHTHTPEAMRRDCMSSTTLCGCASRAEPPSVASRKPPAAGAVRRARTTALPREASATATYHRSLPP